MRNLGNLSPALGSNRPAKRLGRGIGSGTGKTGGKGHKGQRARKSGNVRPGFEGGQTPLYRRIPKHGFTNARSKVEFTIVKLSDLNCFEDGATVDRASLMSQKLVRNAKHPIKLLATGTLEKKKLNVKVDRVSKGAKAVIEKLGGKTEEN